MSFAPPVQNAATVILVRSGAAGGMEVLMNRRPAGMHFLGGFYVFPGGSVKPEDYAESVLNRCPGLSPAQAHRLLGGTLRPDVSLGHWVAGIREVFEETGILLCHDQSGKSVETQRKHLREKRARLLDRAMSFQSFLESEEMLCDVAHMAYFSHWQTPEEFSTRFNTRFYLALLPDDQLPIPSSREVAETLWLSPDQALILCRQGKLPLIFPTYASLRTLADFDSLDSLCAEYHLR
jgi:8-oxo-dGTP pyrophosphatase MutT (NUDIX family)